MADKTADLAGPGIGNYDDLKHELPDDYEALLSPMEMMQAVFAIKNYIEENLCKELNLQMVHWRPNPTRSTTPCRSSTPSKARANKAPAWSRLAAR